MYGYWPDRVAEKELLIEAAVEEIEDAIKKAKSEKKSLRDKQADEISDLRKEIEHLKEKLKLVLEIVRPKPEYTIPLPSQPQWSPDNFGMPDAGIFRIPLRDKPVRPSIIMPAEPQSS